MRTVSWEERVLAEDAGAPAVDLARFKRTMSTFCSGVVVVTGRGEGEPVGFTCQSFSSLSLEPPLVMFAVARTSRSWPGIEAGGRFAVNILADSQRTISDTFAVSRGDKFHGLDWYYGEYGQPLLAGSLARVECAVDAVHPAGDHLIVVGSVLALSESGTGESPLLFFRSGYHALAR